MPGVIRPADINMNIQCIDNETAFLALRDDWEALRLSAEAPSYFLSHDWIRCCWEELKSTKAMRVFIVRSGDRPVLIAPWMLSRISDKRLPATSLTFIEHPETQVADMLILEGSDGRHAFNNLLRYLMTEKASEWNLLLLDKVASDSQTARYLRSSLDEAASSWQSEMSHEALIIPLNKNWQEYLASQSPRFRKTLRNIVNRMQKLGRLDVRTYQGRTAAAEATEKLFSVSDASWKVADGIAITSSTKRMRFFKELSEGAVTAEGIRIVILEVDGKPVASETQIVDRGIVYALRSDYDERFADSSPGTFLQMEILQELFASSYVEYNFGVGLNPYKTRWTEERRQLMRFRLYNDTLYGRLLHTVYRCEPKLSQLPGVRLLNHLFAGK
jgi:CelD/BcsL family acetyltransferase involved in cellulose biosynthesis